MKTVHCNKRPFKCTQCERSFKLNKQLTQHIRIVHDKEKRYMCKWCPAGFFMKIDWEDHCRIHTEEKPYKCELCSNAFKSKREVKRHKEIHNAEKQFECKKCHKRFQQSCNMYKHQKKC